LIIQVLHDSDFNSEPTQDTENKKSTFLIASENDFIEENGRQGSVSHLREVCEGRRSPLGLDPQVPRHEGELSSVGEELSRSL
jgi:hypothetical protein